MKLFYLSLSVASLFAISLFFIQTIQSHEVKGFCYALKTNTPIALARAMALEKGLSVSLPSFLEVKVQAPKWKVFSQQTCHLQFDEYRQLTYRWVE